VADLGELSLWAALPLMLVAAVSSTGGALKGRADVVAFGGRAAEAATGLLVIALAGLASALLAVQLKYAYVAAVSGFQETWGWRLAGLWAGPAGGGLLVTSLIAAGTVVSHRRGRSRQTAARTGWLAVLTLIGLAMVLIQTRPFMQLVAPAAMGAGLPSALRDVSWHVEILASCLAVACGAFAFSGALAGQLMVGEEEPGGRPQERVAMVLAAALLTVAILLATWRAYSRSGVLLDSDGLRYVLAYVPAWLLANSSLHAPGGDIVPVWTSRWRRILEVAFFPAALGAWASALLGFGGPPALTVWVGGLAFGVISGALASYRPRERGFEELRNVPGFGPWAFQAGILTLAAAGVAAVAGLSGGTHWTNVAWALGLLGLGGMGAWSTSRPAGAWQRVWLFAGTAALVTFVGLLASVGRQGLILAVTGALAAAIVVGVAADLARIARSRRGSRVPAAERAAEISSLVRRRAGRRRSAAVAHLGVAVLVLGLAAEPLTNSETRVLYPGDSLSLRDGPGKGVRTTYLGLSRYQVKELQKRVASFRLDRGRAGPELMTAETSYDVATDLTGRRQAVGRGLARDVVVSVDDFVPDEGVRCRLSARPFASLVWLGGFILIASSLRRWT
jgi:cytochrome c biogenesis factor